MLRARGLVEYLPATNPRLIQIVFRRQRYVIESAEPVDLPPVRLLEDELLRESELLEFVRNLSGGVARALEKGGQGSCAAAVRTAVGKAPKGTLRNTRPDEMGAAVIKEAIGRVPGLEASEIEDVIMGCVMQAGEQSNNIARNAIMASKLPESVPGTSIDRQCGSSQQALHFAAQAVMSGTMDIVIAAGVESMTRVPSGSLIVLETTASPSSTAVWPPRAWVL